MQNVPDPTAVRGRVHASGAVEDSDKGIMRRVKVCIRSHNKRLDAEHVPLPESSTAPDACMRHRTAVWCCTFCVLDSPLIVSSHTHRS